MIVSLSKDPFGHSAASPAIFSQLGYSAFTINRIPDADKQRRKATKTLEFVWLPPSSSIAENTSASAQNSLLAHVLDSHYSTPVYSGDSVKEKAASFSLLWYIFVLTCPWHEQFELIYLRFV